ncbi:bifunctional tRNA (5-methylaminomethyl-2-thiouridine)(34)-methyltransferase MnmD/FAD-dependent 5-carboxymethylaminomethyl-2-thiouridine(34) oxidoreductase MnmC, partial [Pseudomonas syringae pv. tagetis]
ASFDFNSTDVTPILTDHLDILELLREISLYLTARLVAADLAGEQLQGRAAFRFTSQDYLPILCPLADLVSFMQAYAALAK